MQYNLAWPVLSCEHFSLALCLCGGCLWSMTVLGRSQGLPDLLSPNEIPINAKIQSTLYKIAF